MTENRRYDAVVIGAGQSGGPLSSALAQSGRKTAIVERKHAGGTCINEGCTPTKTLIASARVAYLARRAREYGVHTGNVEVDLGEVMRRKNKIVDEWQRSSRDRIIEGGADYFDGEASFVSRDTIEVRLNDGGTVRISGKEIFINTGARPEPPTIRGINDVPWLDSTSILDIERLPEHLIVLGGGYVGLEYAQMFARFGSRVTVVQKSGQLLPKEDEDIAAEVAKILREDGISVLLNTTALQVRRDANGDGLILSVNWPDGDQEIAGSCMLAAVGRTPNTDMLNAEAAGVEIDDKGFVKVNERLETNVPGIYAMGDVSGAPAFTHISYDDFRILRDNLLRGGDRTTTGRPIPYVVFTDPQLGRIGLSEKEARAKGITHKVARMGMDGIARTTEVGETRGLMKAVVDPGSKQILGFAVLGFEGGEIMAMVEIAMMGKVPYTALQDAIFAHPTLSEGLNNLFARLEG